MEVARDTRIEEAYLSCATEVVKLLTFLVWVMCCITSARDFGKTER